MKNYKVGDSFVGYKFESNLKVWYNPTMHRYIGVKGIISKVHEDFVMVTFPEVTDSSFNTWGYPIPNEPDVESETEINVELKYKIMKVIKSKEVKVNNKTRLVTVAVVLDKNSGEISGGYSIKCPDDKHNDEMAEKIAIGRALSPRTNLLEMQCGEGMDKKFILHAIADYLLGNIERGVIKIKGVK